MVLWELFFVWRRGILRTLFLVYRMQFNFLTVVNEELDKLKKDISWGNGAK